MKALQHLFGFFLYSLRHSQVRMAVRVSGVVWVLCLIVLIFSIPVFYRHEKIQQELNSRIEERELMKRAGRVFGDYARMIERVNAIEKKWSASTGQAQLIQELNRLCARNDLKMISDDFEPERSGQAEDRLTQEVVVRGSYSDFRRFLLDVEGLPTLTVVTETRLESGGNKPGLVRATLRLVTYQGQRS